MNTLLTYIFSQDRCVRLDARGTRRIWWLKKSIFKRSKFLKKYCKCSFKKMRGVVMKLSSHTINYVINF